MHKKIKEKIIKVFFIYFIFIKEILEIFYPYETIKKKFQRFSYANSEVFIIIN